MPSSTDARSDSPALRGRNGVILTNSDGDQPGVDTEPLPLRERNRRRPAALRQHQSPSGSLSKSDDAGGFAQRWGQNPTMVTSFADGTKISFEQAIVANATGMRVGKRGMLRPDRPAGTPMIRRLNGTPKKHCWKAPRDCRLRRWGAPEPRCVRPWIPRSSGAAALLEPLQTWRRALLLLLHAVSPCHFEGSDLIARAVLFNDAAIQPIAGPQVDVVAKSENRSHSRPDSRRAGLLRDLQGQSREHETSIAETSADRSCRRSCRLKTSSSSVTVRPKVIFTGMMVKMPENGLADKLARRTRNLYVHFGKQRKVV